MEERNLEELYQKMTEGERNAFELFVDWNQPELVEDVLRDCEKRISQEEEK